AGRPAAGRVAGMHRARLSAALLAFATLIAAGCGGGDSHHNVDPEAMLDAAFSKPISSADVDADLALQVTGVPRLRTPARLHLEGPYVSGRGVRIPSFDWDLTAILAGFPVDGRLVSTGENLFLSVYGDTYEVGGA